MDSERFFLGEVMAWEDALSMWVTQFYRFGLGQHGKKIVEHYHEYINSLFFVQGNESNVTSCSATFPAIMTCNLNFNSHKSFHPQFLLHIFIVIENENETQLL